jgi:cobalamin biosynthetic protein CobC
MAEVPITGGAISERAGHGGDLSAIRRRFPDAPRPWIDLSTGINPVPYPVVDLPCEAWSQLPAHDALQSLLCAAARRYGVGDPAAIVAAPGTQALIQLLPKLVPASRVAVLGPTYAEHELCWRRGGHDVTVVSDLAAAAGANVVVVVNPDNPTGQLVPLRELRAVRASLLVVDEAFIDLLPAELSLARDLPGNAVVLRSFGKTYGLAGVRLGFAVASPHLAPLLREELGPWAVSGPALEIGRRALEDDRWLHGAAMRLEKDRERLDALLFAAGFTLCGKTPLFRLADHPQARQLIEGLGRHGIHVRAFVGRPTCLRFGIPAGEEAFCRLAAALQVPQKVR